MTTMQEVLAAHRQGVFADECRGCKLANDGRAYRGFDLAKHQEEMLNAAGFGPVKEAAAKALEDAADELDRRATNVQNNTYLESGIYAELTHRADALQGAARTVRARADAVRGEG